jgi:hypothetical protein
MGTRDSILNIILNIIKQGTGAEDAKGALGDLGGQLSNVATGILGDVIGFTTLAGAGYELYNQLKEDVEAASDAQLTFARLGATVQSTGRSSETSTPQIHAMAEQMRGLFSTEDIESAANALMRFMDIPTASIPGDLQLIQNMAAGLGTTLPEAANTLGMALETGRLRGLGFSREMQNTISTMMSQGDIAGADVIIMDQLNDKFSGQASAQIDTYAGATDGLATAMNDLNVAVGDKALPALTVFKVIGAEAIDLITEYMTSNSHADAQNQLSHLSTDQLNKDYADLNTSIPQTTDAIQKFGDSVALQNIATELQSRQLNFTDDQTIKYTGDLAYLNNVTVTNTGGIKDNTEELKANAAITKEFEGLVNGIAPDLKSMAAAAYQDSLANDGVFSSMDAIAKVGFEKQLGMITDAEAKAMVEAINFKSALDALAGMHITVTVDMLENLLGAVGSSLSPAELASIIARGGQYMGGNTENPSPPSGHSPSSYDTGQKNQYGEMWYDPAAKQYFSKKAAGGPVEPNSYIWNEDPNTRPEVFVSNAGGQILTNQDAKAALGGGGGGTFVVNYSPMISFADEAEFEEHMYPLIDKMIQRSKGRN